MRVAVLRHAAGRLLPAVFLLGAALAAASPQETPADGASAGQALPVRQQALYEQLQRLESRLLRLADTLGETEPEKAERIRDALAKAGEKRIKHRMAELVRTLRSEDFGGAEREQEALLTDMQAVLEILTAVTNDVERRREERKKLEEQQRAVRALIEDQIRVVQQTQIVQAERELAENLRAQADALEALARQNAQLEQEVARSEQVSPEQAARQSQIEAHTRKAVAALERAQAQAGNARSAESIAQSAEAAGNAAEHMRQSAERMQSDDKSAAADAQKSADEQLERAIRRLRDEAERLTERAPLQAIEQAQRDAERRAGDLQKGMTPAEADAQPPPGQRNVAQSRQRMQQAADDLGEENPQEALPAENEALEELQSALNELENVLRQVRREELEETLSALETRFRAMLAREEQIQQSVLQLASRPRAEWERVDELALNETAQQQLEVAEDGTATLRIVVDEGTTVVVPEILRQLVSDMEAVAAALAQASVGAEPQRRLDQIIGVLRELLDAVVAKRSENREQQRQQSGQPQSQSAKALLSGSAELKLLKSAQVRINAETAQAATDGQAEVLQALAARQRQLAELARKIHERE